MERAHAASAENQRTSGPRGEAHGNAKLSDAQIVEIRKRWIPFRGPAGVRRHTIGLLTQSSLAAEYGVSVSQISQVIRGVSRPTQ